MPIYEYQCGACGHEFETIQKLSEPKLEECPTCLEPTLVKKISAVAFRLKGNGWYETDFKSDNKRQLHEDSAKPDAKSNGDAKSESSNSDKQDNSTKSDNTKSNAKSDSNNSSKPANSTA